MIETNVVPQGDSELKAAADKLLEAAMAYWEAHRKATGGAAVVWLTDTDGRMVILTRGEYRDTLMQNVHRLHREEATLRAFET